MASMASSIWDVRCIMVVIAPSSSVYGGSEDSGYEVETSGARGVTWGEEEGEREKRRQLR